MIRVGWLLDKGRFSSAEQRLELDKGSVAVMRGGERKEMCCYVGVPTNCTALFSCLCCQAREYRLIVTHW